MVFGGQTIHLSHIATFLNNLGIFGCNHLLYIKIQRKIMNHPTTIWQNNSFITYILPPPQAFFVALEAGYCLVVVPPFSPSPSPRGRGPVCLFPWKPAASSKPHLHDLQDARTEVEHRLAGTFRGELVLLTERTPKKPEYLIALGTDLQVPFNSQWTPQGSVGDFLGCGGFVDLLKNID